MLLDRVCDRCPDVGGEGRGKWSDLLMAEERSPPAHLLPSFEKSQPGWRGVARPGGPEWAPPRGRCLSLGVTPGREGKPLLQVLGV